MMLGKIEQKTKPEIRAEKLTRILHRPTFNDRFTTFKTGCSDLHGMWKLLLFVPYFIFTLWLSVRYTYPGLTTLIYPDEQRMSIITGFMTFLLAGMMIILFLYFFSSMLREDMFNEKER